MTPDIATIKERVERIRVLLPTAQPIIQDLVTTDIPALLRWGEELEGAIREHCFCTELNETGPLSCALSSKVKCGSIGLCTVLLAAIAGLEEERRGES
jgi:hypothetical protein